MENSKGGTINVCEMLRVNLLLLQLLQDLILARYVYQPLKIPILLLLLIPRVFRLVRQLYQYHFQKHHHSIQVMIKLHTKFKVSLDVCFTDCN